MNREADCFLVMQKNYTIAKSIDSGQPAPIFFADVVNPLFIQRGSNSRGLGRYFDVPLKALIVYFKQEFVHFL